MTTERRISQQIRMVERVLAEYGQQRGTPLARFLSGFFKRNRQMGSSDRRAVARLVYHYFRIGSAARDLDLSTRLAIADFLCSDDSVLADHLPTDFQPAINGSLDEKIYLLEDRTAFRLKDIFPYSEYLSAGLDGPAYVKGLLVQPDLFIRLRPGYEAEVKAQLTEKGISFRPCGERALALPNGTSLDRIPEIRGKYAVQDYSSQQTGRYFKAGNGERWWDACAGAGGKSLLLNSLQPGVSLLVSDVRASILRNLNERFEEAGIRRYRQKIIDLTQGTRALGTEQFDGIILDAPCSGSGTWGRTPEMITHFSAASLFRFSTLQQQLARQALRHLPPGKPLIYITCSVFAAENEEVVDALRLSGDVEVEAAELISGYHHRADSLFVARLIKR